jgi:hypothetical protein
MIGDEEEDEAIEQACAETSNRDATQARTTVPGEGEDAACEPPVDIDLAHKRAS